MSRKDPQSLIKRLAFWRRSAKPTRSGRGIDAAGERLSPDLRQWLRDNPDASVNLIVRVDEVNQLRQQALERHGFTIRHRYTLVPGFAVEGQARAALDLLAESWVQRIERDAPVKPYQG